MAYNVSHMVSPAINSINSSSSNSAPQNAAISTPLAPWIPLCLDDKGQYLCRLDKHGKKYEPIGHQKLNSLSEVEVQQMISAAESNNPFAQFDLATYYRYQLGSAKKLPQEVTNQKAFKLFLKAANDHRLPAAEFALGDFYKSKRLTPNYIVEKNNSLDPDKQLTEDKAKRLRNIQAFNCYFKAAVGYIEAAEGNNPPRLRYPGLIQAQFELYLRYQNSTYHNSKKKAPEGYPLNLNTDPLVKFKFKEEKEWCQKAADNGHAIAQYQYWQNTIDPKDKIGLGYLKMSAAQGYQPAIKKLKALNDNQFYPEKEIKHTKEKVKSLGNMQPKLEPPKMELPNSSQAQVSPALQIPPLENKLNSEEPICKRLNQITQKNKLIINQHSELLKGAQVFLLLDQSQRFTDFLLSNILKQIQNKIGLIEGLKLQLKQFKQTQNKSVTIPASLAHFVMNSASNMRQEVNSKASIDELLSETLNKNDLRRKWIEVIMSQKQRQKLLKNNIGMIERLIGLMNSFFKEGEAILQLAHQEYKRLSFIGFDLQLGIDQAYLYSLKNKPMAISKSSSSGTIAKESISMETVPRESVASSSESKESSDFTFTTFEDVLNILDNELIIYYQWIEKGVSLIVLLPTLIQHLNKIWQTLELRIKEVILKVQDVMKLHNHYNELTKQKNQGAAPNTPGIQLPDILSVYLSKVIELQKAIIDIMQKLSDAGMIKLLQERHQKVCIDLINVIPNIQKTLVEQTSVFQLEMNIRVNSFVSSINFSLVGTSPFAILNPSLTPIGTVSSMTPFRTISNGVPAVNPGTNANTLPNSNHTSTSMITAPAKPASTLLLSHQSKSVGQKRKSMERTLSSSNASNTETVRANSSNPSEDGNVSKKAKTSKTEAG